jgi:hypothetical protein
MFSMSVPGFLEVTCCIHKMITVHSNDMTMAERHSIIKQYRKVSSVLTGTMQCNTKDCKYFCSKPRPSEIIKVTDKNGEFLNRKVRDT